MKFRHVLVLAFWLAVIIFCLSGCQSIGEMEFYAPESETMVKGSDGYWRGAVKRENNREGVRDYSPKSLKVSAF